MEQNEAMNSVDADRISTQIGPLLEQRPEYAQRCVTKMTFTVHDKERRLGQNVAKLLCNLLHRSQYLFDGSIHALRGAQVLSAYLTVRAHMETTGCIQFVMLQLCKYYDNTLDAAAINNIVFHQFLGGRTFPDRGKHPDAPDAVQILKCVDSVDKAVELKQLNPKINFREIYDMLSEYCHPNFLGHSVGVDTDGSGNVTYTESQSFDNVDLTNVCLGLAASCFVLFSAYDHAMSMLSEHEVMPEVHK